MVNLIKSLPVSKSLFLESGKSCCPILPIFEREIFETMQGRVENVVEISQVSC